MVTSDHDAKSRKRFRNFRTHLAEDAAGHQGVGLSSRLTVEFLMPTVWASHGVTVS